VSALPATGKTLLAKPSRRGRCGFVSASAFELRGVFLRRRGQPRARHVRASPAQPPCLIFIDSIDAVGESGHALGGGNDDARADPHALLVDMDGFDTQEGIIISPRRTGRTCRPGVVAAAGSTGNQSYCPPCGTRSHSSSQRENVKLEAARSLSVHCPTAHRGLLRANCQPVERSRFAGRSQNIRPLPERTGKSRDKYAWGPRRRALR